MKAAIRLHGNRKGEAMSDKNNINDFQGRIFTFNFPARLTGTPYPLPARNLAVVVFPDIPKQENSQEGNHRDGTGWSGWYPQCKPGLEIPWDSVTWGRLPNPIPENFIPYAPVQFGNAYPLSKNELFPIIKKTRALFGRDFYAFILLFDYKTENGDMIYAHEEKYRLTGDFPGFENYPAVDL
jgi:hypothetical protein